VERQLALAESSNRSSDRSMSRDQFHNLAIRCRFAYEHALRVAPEFEYAHHGLAECLCLQIEHMADNQNYQSARTLLNELGALPAALRERVAELSDYIHERERTHKEQRDELATQVQHALVDRLRIAEERVQDLEAQLAGEGEEATRRMVARNRKNKPPNS
jgi:uncharacterized membrane protein YccC